MKVLVVGSGGREHALAWACSRSKLKPQIFCAPGNGGTAAIAENVDIDPAKSNAVLEFVTDHSIDLVIVGPEAPLVDGLADILTSSGCSVFGPSLKAAKIEGSKSFAKRLMRESGVVTAGFKTLTNLSEAEQYILSRPVRWVVKASGLAAGKGAIICDTSETAISTARSMLEEGRFGDAGREIVVEEYLEGPEASVMVFADGEDYLLLPLSRDHKPAFDGDRGPNTGGMGAYSPLDDLKPEDISQMAEAIFPPILKKLTEIDVPYRGLLYAGLMLTDMNAKDKGMKVLEFNCRFGDPETQAQLPIINVDLLEIMIAVAEGKLKKWMTENDYQPGDWMKLTGDQHAAAVVAAVTGYPGSYPKGMKITSLPEETDTVITFHAGTRLQDGELISTGGRVLAVTGLGKSHSEAVETAYRAMEQVKFEGVRYRRDIGRKENR